MPKHALTRRHLLLASAAALAATPAAAREDAVWTNFWGLALRGYDPVAYFTEGRPVEGVSDHSAKWNGAEWRFASAANREAFLADPEKYAPPIRWLLRLGGQPGLHRQHRPEAWEIVDGKLYMNYSLGVRDQWRQNRAENIAKGDRNWPNVLK